MKQVPALLCIDSYKLGHIVQYPEGTEFVYSNMTPRSLSHFKVPEPFDDKQLVAFGMHAAIKEIHDVFRTTFFDRPIDEVLFEFAFITDPFLGDNSFPVEHIARLHTLGFLPIQVKALAEGTITQAGIPVLTIVNTDPDMYWLTNFLETWLSAELWKPMTAASIARAYRRILDHYASLTGSSIEFVDWQAHDFSARGMSGINDAASTGMGHLLFFKGSDNIPAAITAQRDYYVDDDELVASSVPATEHSVMCIGEQENELETIRRLIQDIYPTGIVSIVADSWDFWKAITVYAAELKDIILSRGYDSLGASKVVWRPDTGNPIDIICGTAIPINHQTLLAELDETSPGVYVTERGYFNVDENIFSRIEDPTPEMKGAVECLWDIFGGTRTFTNHKLLNHHVGVIYGDSITLERAAAILERLHLRGYASQNIVFGVGSYTYQCVTRDTLGTAIKATWGVVDGQPRNIFKDPATGHSKKSARGLLSVDNVDGVHVLNEQVSMEKETTGLLQIIYLNGKFTGEVPNLRTIRQRARS